MIQENESCWVNGEGLENDQREEPIPHPGKNESSVARSAISPRSSPTSESYANYPNF